MKLQVILCCIFQVSWSLPSSFFVKSPETRQIVKRQAGSDGRVKITEMKITSDIQFRYSRTVVESYVKNFGDTAKSAKFKLILPNSAFISNFSMIVDGVEHVGEVKSKEEARKQYEHTVDQGLGAGLVEKESRDANVFQIQTNVEAAGKVVFRLTYDELLHRKLGLYEQAVHIQPGQIVDNFKVIININESLPLTKIFVPELKDSNELDFTKVETASEVSTIFKNVDEDPSKARIELDITEEYQKSFGEKGIQGEFLVQYDVDRQNQTSEVQVIDGHFVHFFTPENLKTLPKHIVFVLDVSGSMYGEKMTQVKDAMFTILDEMTDQDQFDIITFSTDVNKWKPSNTNQTMAFKASEENKKKGIEMILSLEASGGTNINDAVQEALELALQARLKEVVNSGVSTMILFMTDGQPTEGTTDRFNILENIRNLNEKVKVPIFSLAFGADADFDLLVDISEKADSHAKQIYEGSDAAIQLEGFYKEISSPLLSDLQFKYVGDSIDNDTLTTTDLKTFFKGDEFIVAGKFLPAVNLQFKVEVVANAGDEVFEEQIIICPLPEDDKLLSNYSVVPPYPCYQPPKPSRSQAQTFLKNLYAFLNIQQLLKKNDKESKEKALQMSLDNNFVTDLTSLIVTKDSKTQEAELIKATARPNELNTLKFNSISFQHSHISSYDYYDHDMAYMIYESLDDTEFFSASTTTTRRTFYTTTTTTTTTASQTTTTTSGQCELSLFTKTYKRGDEQHLQQSTSDLQGFNDRSVSASLEGSCCWVLYSSVNFSGDSVRLDPANTYTSVTSFGSLLRNVKSVQKTNC